MKSQVFPIWARLGFLTIWRPQGSWPAHEVAKGFKNRYSSKQQRHCFAFMILPGKSPLLLLLVTKPHSGSRGGDTDINSCWVECRSHLVHKHWDGDIVMTLSGKRNCSLPAIFLNHNLNPPPPDLATCYNSQGSDQPLPGEIWDVGPPLEHHRFLLSGAGVSKGWLWPR